jgi:hypothetical protein
MDCLPPDLSVFMDDEQSFAIIVEEGGVAFGT